MIQPPRLPLTTEALPQQRLVEVIDLPAWPVHAEITVCLTWRPEEILPRRHPQRMLYLGTVEWAWMPLYSRFDAYYLQRGRHHWIAWIRDPFPNEAEDEWRIAAHAPRCGVTEEQVAVHLIAARWRAEAEERALDRFHLVSEEGVLRVPDWQAIAREVWPDAP